MMKRLSIGWAALTLLAVLFGCEPPNRRASAPVETGDSVTAPLPDSTLYGHLGESTAMSCLEFITDEGDTLMLNKRSEYTGLYGEILGTVENYTDRFGIVVTDNRQSVGVAINLTQLAHTWHSAEQEGKGFCLKEGGHAEPLTPESPKCSGWRLYNGRLLFYRQVMGEYGEETRTDTTRILLLDTDSLVLWDRNNTLHRYYR